MKHTALLILLFPILVFSQVTNEGKPLSWNTKSLNNKKINLPSFDLKQIEKEDAQKDKKGEGPWRFGYEHLVDLGLKTNGHWTNLPDGSRYWLLNIKSEGAKTMNFIFDEFYLPKGAKLYFYNADRTDVLGAYTHTQNRKDMVFGSWLVDGDDIYIEYHEPADKINEGRLHISKAVHGYRSVSDFAKQAKSLNDSGDCNLDVDCPIGTDFDDLKDDLKKSVGLILVGSSGFCSGTLINNTNNDETPYFLTANHCLGSNIGNWAFRFNWRSPNPQCATVNGSANGSFDQTVSGASLKASNSKSDVALLEITAPLPNSWDLVWAGWDRTNTNPNFAVGIHHPSGDIMKICRDDDGPLPGTTSFNGNSSTQIWQVGNWEQGVTEPGSSGSALFNQDGRIIGQLAGGSAACAGTVNNNGFDVYGRFATSWSFGNTASTRLSDWLDPNNTGATTLDQFPPKQLFNNDAKLIISNLPSEICGDEVQPLIKIQNVGTDPITSVILSYELNLQTPVNINWNGNLQSGQTEIIDNPILDIVQDNNALRLSLELPNGVPDDFDANNNIVRNFSKITDYETNSINLELITDDFGNETTWVFEDENGNIIDQGGPFLNNVTINETFAVNPNLCYKFTIFDSQFDGICCGFGQGSYSLTTAEGIEIFSGGEFLGEESINISIIDKLSIDEFDKNNIIIYPNPASNFLNINSDSQDLDFEMFDINGKLILRSNQKKIDISGISKGMYFLKINTTNNQFITKKVIIE